MRLISEEVINKYLIKSRSINGKSFSVFMEYTGDSVDDSGEQLAGIYSVGFISPEGNEYRGRMILPILREDGLLLRNKSIWYPVTLVIPPMRFHTGSKNERYLHSVISLSGKANSVTEFMPAEMSAPMSPTTPLTRELYPASALDARSMWNWNALTLDVLIVEMVNHKITDDIFKSRKGGFTGISASIKASHTLLNAVLRYKEGMSEWGKTEDLDNKIEDDIESLGRISVEDANSVVVIHDLACNIDIQTDGPIDFCTCSPSIPIRTARIRDGVNVIGCRFSGNPSFPYTKWRRAIPGIASDDPRRVIVSKSITRAMTLNEPDLPAITTDVTLTVDSLSMPGVRFTHPLTHNDGIIVSRTFADKCGAFKMYIDKFIVSDSSEVMIKVKPVDTPDVKEYAREVARVSASGTPFQSRSVIRRGETIADIMYVDENSTQVIEQYKSKAKVDSVVIKMDKFVPETDMPEKGMMYRVVSLAYLPLTVGDKLADAHGNKGTVSAILEDEDMPIIRFDDSGLDRHAHYVAYPFVSKRLPVGAEIEDKLALANKMAMFAADKAGEAEAEVIVIDSSENITLDEADEILAESGGTYLHNVEFEGKTYSNVPLCYRMIFRLDNNAVETLSTKATHSVSDNRRMTNNVIMGIDLVTMLTRGAKALVDWLITGSKSGELTSGNVLPILYAISGTYPYGAPTYEIEKTIDRGMLGKVFRTEKIAEEDFEGTVCDYRAENHYGIIRMGKRFIVVPPHKPIYQVNYGHSMIDSISKLANRVFAEYKSSRTEFREYTDVESQIKRYNDTLCNYILGKDSIMRSSLLPVFPTSVRAVASPYIGSDPLEVAIPRKSFNYLFAVNEKFRNIYKHKENHYCIIKRDPVHRENNVIALRFKLWDNDTIGLFPSLMEGLDGDFDGDSVFALFPTDWDAHYDMQKLIPSIDSSVKSSKHLTDVDPRDIYDVLHEKVGESSSFTVMHPLDQPKNPDLMSKLITGISREDILAETMKAARDFFTIKDGTARTGALGLTFIFTRSPEKSHILRDAMELYHMMAQNTLDAKAGISLPALKVVSGASSGDIVGISAALDELGYPSNECREEFLQFVTEMKKAGGRSKYMSSKSPVFGCLQKQASSASAVSLSKRFMSGIVSGEGVYDGLFDYITGRLRISPFQWADKEDILTRRINMYKDKLKHKFEGGF